MIGLVAGQLVLGPLSDAWGRRRLLLGATVVCAVASLLCALAPSAAVLTVWRFVQGFSGGGGIVLARAVAADLTSGVAAARLFSLFMTLSSVAPIVAPVLGGVLLVWTGSWPVMFYLLAAINAALAVADLVRRPGVAAGGASGTAAGCGRPAGPSATWPATGCSSATP